MKCLVSSIEANVRFSETDAMGVVWHGNYLKYFEDARERFGEEHGMDYLDFHRNGYFTPIVKSEIQHHSSLFYGDSMRIVAKLIHTQAAKMMFEYEIYHAKTNVRVASGKTMQVFLAVENRALQLTKPDFYVDWEKEQPWQPFSPKLKK